jgi:tetratricopeptide (TPR) repeat protein
MASSIYHMLPRINRFAGEIYNTAVPTLREAFDVNPIAAMPSLHAAVPILTTCVAVRLYGWKGSILVPYTVFICFGLVYEGEHYLADIFVGIVISSFVYGITYHSRLVDGFALHVGSRLSSCRKGFWGRLDTEIKQKAFVACVILASAELTGQIVLRGKPSFKPTRRFVERELSGKSDRAGYYAGNIALIENDFSAAQIYFEKAYRELEANQKVVDAPSRQNAALAAFLNGDNLAVVESIGELPLSQMRESDAILAAIAYARLDRIEKALKFLEAMEIAYP